MDFTKIALNQLAIVVKSLPLVKGTTERNRINHKFKTSKHRINSSRIIFKNTNFNAIRSRIQRIHNNIFIPNRIRGSLKRTSFLFSIIILTTKSTTKIK